MTKKVKLFKKIFQTNADHQGIDVTTCADSKRVFLMYMSEETFVPLMGQMWDKAKKKYHKKREDITLEFAEWCQENYTRNLLNSKIFWYKQSDLPNANFKTTKQLYDEWVEQKRKG